MHDVRIALDDHQVRDADGAVFRDAPYVVATEIDEHQVLGALLLVGDQLGHHAIVVGCRAPATARTGDGTERHRSSCRHAHEQFRRAPDDLDAVEH